MEPLVGMLPYCVLERTQDFSSELVSGSGGAEAGAVVLDFGEDRGVVAAGGVADEVDGEDEASGGAGYFGWGN
jgi:hypothetical protein